ncbi:hypothetical protein [Halochromatium roseum]|uniref:hypothetical protein n=1 Tax=Halochromatium roseum TaxID=391920 RepID=UPI00191301CF|nr:hypothetical protein [Halochromatium roseum]
MNLFFSSPTKRSRAPIHSGKRVTLFSVLEDRVDSEYAYPLRRGMRLSEHTIDHTGQALQGPRVYALRLVDQFLAR